MHAEDDFADTSIRETNKRFMSAFADGKAGDVAALYTDDGQLLPPSGAIVAGKPGIAAYWEGAMKQGIARIELGTLELDHQGATAIEVGRARLFGKEGDTAAAVKYLVVWKKQNGNWKLHRDIWNSDGA